VVDLFISAVACTARLGFGGSSSNVGPPGVVQMVQQNQIIIQQHQVQNTASPTF
jgi:hypothetical protein